ncbi:hypothetical protein PIB30_009275 [Stylosanthes scabra]|uniref:Uncharacterized protein n=1 Tax=Stylosanthes scabra TaxID=79078 RepID=A0ABU6R687_9FABA|nr:hypothetical protein [Stylosanthes scabra]
MPRNSAYSDLYGDLPRIDDVLADLYTSSERCPTWGKPDLGHLPLHLRLQTSTRPTWRELRGKLPLTQLKSPTKDGFSLQTWHRSALQVRPPTRSSEDLRRLHFGLIRKQASGFLT